jgi:hypothetical protein
MIIFGVKLKIASTIIIKKRASKKPIKVFEGVESSEGLCNYRRV